MWTIRTDNLIHFKKNSSPFTPDYCDIRINKHIKHTIQRFLRKPVHSQ